MLMYICHPYFYWFNITSTIQRLNDPQSSVNEDRVFQKRMHILVKAEIIVAYKVMILMYCRLIICVCHQIRRCDRHETEPAMEALQTIGNFQFSGKLPRSTGENKYTENMTPGYTGIRLQQPIIYFCDIHSISEPALVTELLAINRLIAVIIVMCSYHQQLGWCTCNLLDVSNASFRDHPLQHTCI